jgi:hypothetical protein
MLLVDVSIASRAWRRASCSTTAITQAEFDEIEAKALS